MNKAYTILELLIVIGLISIMTAMLVPAYRTGQQSFALYRSAHKLAQDIRRAQEMAVSSREYQGSVPPGYGIYLQQGDNFYRLYADTNPAAGNEKYTSADSVVERIDLEKKVYIKNVSPASVSINFRPPDPKTRISGTGVDEAAIVTITLSLETDPAQEKIIKANKAGLIYVE